MLANRCGACRNNNSPTGKMHMVNKINPVVINIPKILFEFEKSGSG